MDIYKLKLGEKLLFLGEGNFSFCVDYVKFNDDIFTNSDSLKNLSTDVIATCYESSDNASDLKRSNISFLRERGITVLFNIDATNLKNYTTLAAKKFTKIIFNFPHVGGKMKIHLNRKLLAEIFLSSKDILDENGQVLLTLCDGQGGTDADNTKRRWDDTWKVVEMSAEAGFALEDVYPFLSEYFPGYISTGFRSLDKGFNLDNALVHVFKMSNNLNFLNFSDEEIIKLFQVEEITTSFETEEISKVYSKKLLHNPLKFDYTPQSYLYDEIKKIQFRIDVQFFDDLDLIYGFPCHHKTSCGFVREHLTSNSNNNNKIRIFKGLFLNKLTNNFLQQPVCCEILCVGNESGKIAKQIVSELLVLFDNDMKLNLSSNKLEQEESFYVDDCNKLEVIKINTSVSSDNYIETCTIFLDNLAVFLLKLNSWHELWAEGSRININNGKTKLLTPCLFPCTYVFHLSFSTQEDYEEEKFYDILWHIAGDIISKVSLISTYQPSNKNYRNFCYEITYRSYELPLYRRRVIDIQNNLIGDTLKKLLNVIIL